MSLPLPEAPDVTADGDLAARAAAGDTPALGELYRRHAPDLTLLAARLLASRADGEDVVQDLFVGLPEALAGYREAGRLPAWLRRLTVNLALKRLRTVRRRREADIEPVLAAPAANADQVSLRRAVEVLPVSLRTVVVLKVVEGYSHAEIGELLGISRGASEVRLTRALDRLRKALEG